MSNKAIINQFKKEIELLKAQNEDLIIYVVSVGKNGNESEPKLLLSCKIGDVL